MKKTAIMGLFGEMKSAYYFQPSAVSVIRFRMAIKTPQAKALVKVI